ncbi:conserved hypothetical protein [Histoplasma capsulatum G186AR]|uniref:G-patch domain-containing protein n=2 Tax=Ajellomyces capsulatus TaxID=5037 RepID=C0NIP6_AJECG|nr:uncharacterized protein HCBG_02303 [Histoplasma capsulatum G186AR]EEH08766.1 conserved hypothetical protein [Histoplasma capsulatum G186AR]
MASQPPPKGGMMSLYANLLDPASDNGSAPGTISRAPVVFKQSGENDAPQDDAASKKQQISAASLRFQPTKRPQLASQKTKAKPGIPKAPVVGSAVGTSPVSGIAVKPTTKTSLADWAATAEEDDVNGFYGGEKRQRGGRKKRKKHREETNLQNWDDIYDPSRPNSYEAYRHSDEKIREVREWKDRLYAHRMARRTSSGMDSDEEYSRSPRNRQFGPPGLNFAPPPNLNEPRSERQDSEGLSEPAPAVSTTIVPDDATGEDAYARRLRMSQNYISPDPGSTNIPIPPPPPTSSSEPLRPQPPPPDQVFASATISRAPVRYTLPPAPEEIPATEAELEATFAKEEDRKQEPDGEGYRSLRPGQKGFAERLLSKYGWTKGSGLGASGEGIVKPLQVKLEKQKKKPASEGGGLATPAGRANIVGGNQKKSEDGKFGRMSEVVVLHGMVDGMDLDAELENGEGGGLMQEIGDECAEKYGRVERVFIDRNSPGKIPVFVKFTSQLSALRAVNALEGRIFNGNTIIARFFDVDKFEQGVYE